MKRFVGFPAGKTRLTPLPDLFFSELVGQIDDLAELKFTLLTFWFLHRQTGQPRYMMVRELEAEGIMLSALRAAPDETREDLVAKLHRSIDRAVARGTFLQLDVDDKEGEVSYLFANSANGRKAVEQIKRGELVLEARGPISEPHVEQERPNIFQLYEENIGLLQPLLAQELEEAARDYPQSWIEEAFTIAAEHNARNWRYVRAILERWGREGKDDGNQF